MDSANFHHQHQLQEQLAEYFTSAAQSGYKASTTHDWIPSIVLNNGSNYNSYLTESIPNSREMWPKCTINEQLLRPSMNEDSSFSNARSTQQSADEFLFAKIKEETPDTFPKLSEMICNPSSSEESHSLSIRNELQCSPNNLWLSNFSSGRQIIGQPSAGDLYSNTQNPASFGGVAGSSRCNFSHVFPSTNSSLSDLSSSLISSSSLGLSLQTLDLLTSTNYGGSFSQSSHDIFGIRRDRMSLSPDHMQELADSPSNSYNKTTAFMNGVTRKKRASSVSEAKESHAVAKKSQSGSRCSCPPLKVRKEKLGDRIAALQRLVAPFGKTDTASVLTEAIGYIQFLHDQVQGLSDKDGTELERDLKSRGLCLLPLSYASYVSGYE
ncbi:transcription factor bHLH110-like isoform X2 [Castanea sativa]|uniref:transcription factor bHLH110-like isoform X2 n=1 Tax=Castanea sativa TaxID=21020 RepID=UPI003F64DE44